MAAGNPNQQPAGVSESQPASNPDQQPEAASEKQRRELDVADSRSNVSDSPSESPLRQSDAESAPLASKGVVDQVVDHSLLIVAQLEKAATATKSAVVALVGSPRGVEELPADVQVTPECLRADELYWVAFTFSYTPVLLMQRSVVASSCHSSDSTQPDSFGDGPCVTIFFQGPYREACSVLSETEAVVESSLKSCHKNAISELHDVDETISLICSEQVRRFAPPRILS
jgi:hypothetical protein